VTRITQKALTHADLYHNRWCCPAGKSRDPSVQPCVKKYFDSLLTQITHISLAIPAHAEGRFAIVTDVGHGMRWTRHVKRRMTLRADGEVVWS
jgi:hypothetical protein